MDIQRIADYMDAVDIKHCGTNIFSCLRKEQWLQEYCEMVRAKRKDFDACILEWCLAHGVDAARSLVVYKEKLEWYQKCYDDEFNRFVCSSKNFEENEIIIFFKFMREETLKSMLFIDKIINEYGKIDMPNTDDKTDKKITNVYYATNHTNKKLRRVYNYLIDNGHLDADTPLSDFLYFFTGRSKKVNDCLKWKSSKVGLAYFIDAIIVKGGTKDKQFWKKAETIFRESNLANKYSQSVKNKDNSQNEKIANDIQRLLKIK